MSGAPEEAVGGAAGEAGSAFAELVALVDRMVSPGGDRWLRAQTHASLVRYLIEESAEVVEAIEAPAGPDRELLREELGDLLFQVVFHARLAQDGGSAAANDPVARGSAALEGTGRPFDIAAVVRDLTEKMVRRHPHLFAPQAGTDSLAPGVADAAGDREPTPAEREAELERMTRAWDAAKRAEKPERTGAFDGIPPGLPALARAEKALNKAAKAGLSLPAPLPFPGMDADVPGAGSGEAAPASPALQPTSTVPAAIAPDSTSPASTASVSPESVAAGSREAAEAQVGRSLLGLVSRCRELGVDPEKALRRAVREWIAAREAPNHGGVPLGE